MNCSVQARRFRAGHGRPGDLSEWTLMEDVNDGPGYARALAVIAMELREPVNVIALNPTPLAPQRRPSAERTRRFVEEVNRQGSHLHAARHLAVPDIDAACGQLRVESATKQREHKTPTIGTTERHRDC